MTEFCHVEDKGWLAIISLDRVACKNALHPAAHYELEQVFDDLETRAGLRCIILTGAGDSFCAGYDLKDNLETGVMEIAAKGFGGLTSRTDYKIPIIAAVNGVAFGGGFEMALACDLVIASTAARFALPEAKVGWSPLGGGLQRLPRIIGLTRALGMVLTGRIVSAEEGERMGFINCVVTPDLLLSTAMEWAQMIADGAPLAIACNREVAKASVDMASLAAALDVSNYASVAPMLGSEDAVEGKRAFTERRCPIWRGV
jgi:enoyl-CoA hydratase/carnithine racemase